MVKKVKILCWNVNGVRAAQRHGFVDWLNKESPDIQCLQETKAMPDQLDTELRQPLGYRVCWNYQEWKGYGGVATFMKQEPLSTQISIGITEFDVEGRIIICQYPEFILFNVYFPNGKKDAKRLKYKMDFYDAFFDFIEPMRRKSEKLIVCGDFNTAHKEIDIARPKENEKVSGFLPMERAWLDKLVEHGYIDTFRHFHPEPEQYTWWDMKTRARERNVGWRIDYFFITENLLPSIEKAYIMPEVMGSDHCPIGLTLDI